MFKVINYTDKYGISSTQAELEMITYNQHEANKLYSKPHSSCMNEWMNEWTNEQTNEWMNGWMDGWMNEWMSD